jgi:hypothetical protein
MMSDRYNPNPNGVTHVDPFLDGHIDSFFWESTPSGGVTITESNGRINIDHEAAAAIGSGLLSSKFLFGWQTTNSVGITLATGSLAADGDHAEASLVLYKDVANYIKFGPYRDTSEAKNANRIRINLGLGESVIDLSAVDNFCHQYTISVLENHTLFLLDGVIVYDLETIGFLDYLIRFESVVQNAADHVHAQFTNFIISKDTHFLAAIYPPNPIKTFSGNITLTGITPAELTFDAATYGAEFELVLVAGLGKGTVGKAVKIYNAGTTFTDYTIASNNLVTRDVKPFTSAPVNGDQFAVMAAYKFCYVDVYMEGGVANTNNVLTLKYWNGAAWAAIPGVVDGTFDTQSLGKSGRVSFVPPAGWATKTIDGYTGYAIVWEVTAASTDVPYITHIQVSDDTATSFDQVAAAFDTLLVYIKRNYPITGYSSMFADKMEYIQAIGERDVDINAFRCLGDTKVGFQLNTTPAKNVVIPYFGYARRLA